MGDLLRNNHLEDQALSIVSATDSIDEMWDKLIKSFGDPRMMLNKKLKRLHSLNCFWKHKDAEKIAD